MYWNTVLQILCFFTFNSICDCVFVETTFGWIRGRITNNAIVFLGVPFAEPPKRWEDPREPRRWGAIYDARKVRPMCLQEQCSAAQIKLRLTCLPMMSEDCLYLNVYLPLSAKPSSKKAVMVFLHGGAFDALTAGAKSYNSENFVDKGDVIMVTLNYRLGALGFLVTGTGQGAAAGNYGLKDQRLALRWVNKNIEKFGGDPNNVTLFGQSAGATSALIHIASKKADKFFHKTIIQSAPLSIPLRSLHQAYMQGQEFSRQLNCPPENINCLKSKTPMDIIKAQSRVKVRGGSFLQQFMPWSPHYDGDEVPVSLINVFQKRLHYNKPLIIGTTANEGIPYIYESFKRPLSSITYSALLLMMKPKKAMTWLSKYNSKSSDDSRKPLSELTTDWIFKCPSWKMASDAASSQIKVWVYVFDHGLKFLKKSDTSMTNCYDYACHGGEIPYLFQNIDRVGIELDPIEEKLSREMLQYWTNFAKYGDPNSNINAKLNVTEWWPKYDVRQNTLSEVFKRFKTPKSALSIQSIDKSCDLFTTADFV